ncbi:MAG TPA: response regulator [Patescibacteria group bacterium]|nr:response regulator [Patescibacteria group bacterium]
MGQPDLKKGFGAELKRRRIASGLSQETLAELSDLHRTYISAVESGKRNLTLESIQRLATALGATVASFFNEVEARAKSDPIFSAGGVNAAEMSPRSGGGILLVEDDPRDVAYTLTAFNTAKLANPVTVVKDGAAALDYLLGRAGGEREERRRLPQMVLLDLQLPKVHGLEVLRRLKANRRTENIPVVVLTGSDRDADVEEAMRLGASSYLIKPVDFHRLAEVTPKLRFRWALL